MSELTVGQKTMQIGNGQVYPEAVREIKVRTSDLIDYIVEATSEVDIDEPDYGDVKRLTAIAITQIEGASMFAVKAVSKL